MTICVPGHFTKGQLLASKDGENDKELLELLEGESGTILVLRALEHVLIIAEESEQPEMDGTSCVFPHHTAETSIEMLDGCGLKRKLLGEIDGILVEMGVPERDETCIIARGERA